jgi:hypothetical protein
LQFVPFLSRHLDGQLVPSRVRLNAAVIEHHRQHRDGLADRLLLAASGVELSDEVSDRLCVNPLDGDVTETGE